VHVYQACISNVPLICDLGLHTARIVTFASLYIGSGNCSNAS